MTLLPRLRSVWTFLVRERIGYYRPPPVPASVLTDADRQLHLVAERKHREIEKALRYLDALNEPFRRME